VSGDVDSKASQLLDETPDFRAVGGNLLRDLGAAYDDGGVLHEQAEDAAETEIRGDAGLRGHAVRFHANYFLLVDAGIMRDVWGKAQITGTSKGLTTEGTKVH
jgi:hypothetical protein